MDTKPEAKTKLRKRPCSACGRWFLPDHRVRRCQKTCSRECGKKWAARRESQWRRKNPDYEADRRVRKQLCRAEQQDATVEVGPSGAQLARLPWRLMQTAFGVKKAVILAFALRLLKGERQTAIRVRIFATSRSPGRLLSGGRQTAMEDIGQAPDDSLCTS